MASRTQLRAASKSTLTIDDAITCCRCGTGRGDVRCNACDGGVAMREKTNSEFPARGRRSIQFAGASNASIYDPASALIEEIQHNVQSR
jgi:hypothetical protein